MMLPGELFLYISSGGIEFKGKNDIAADIISISNKKSSMSE
jgi:hypothetical protein